MGLLDRLAPRRSEEPPAPVTTVDDPVFATKALRKFLNTVTTRESRVVLDLGPVVGSNISFLGEQVGCKIFVEDIYADLERLYGRAFAAVMATPATEVIAEGSQVTVSRPVRL